MESANFKISTKIDKSENKMTEEQQKAIEALRKKIHHDITNIKNINTSDEYLLRWLYSTDYDIEISFKRMKDYHENIIEYPDWYRKISPLERKADFKSNMSIMLPNFDKNGRPIYIAKLGKLDPNKASLSEEPSLEDIWYEFILDKHPEISEKGVCIIMDVKDVTWKFIKMFNYNDIKISFKRLDSLPFKEFKVHVVNNSRITKAIMNIFQPFLPEDSRKKILFHFDGMVSLQDHIDKDCLPLEYDGNYEIDYNKMYESLFEKSEVIKNNFCLYRNVRKT